MVQIGFIWLRPNVVVRWLTLLRRIREVQGSNLGSETGYPEVMWFYSVSPGECRDSTLKSGHDRFLPNPFRFIVHLSPYRSTLHSLELQKS
jgi:hypothetical protein